MELITIRDAGYCAFAYPVNEDDGMVDEYEFDELLPVDITRNLNGKYSILIPKFSNKIFLNMEKEEDDPGFWILKNPKIKIELFSEVLNKNLRDLIYPDGKPLAEKVLSELEHHLKMIEDAEEYELCTQLQKVITKIKCNKFKF